MDIQTLIKGNRYQTLIGEIDERIANITKRKDYLVQFADAIPEGTLKFYDDADTQKLVEHYRATSVGQIISDPIVAVSNLTKELTRLEKAKLQMKKEFKKL